MDRPRLRPLALLFGRLSLTSFGGPAAHIAMMREALVVRRQWLSDPEFLDLVGASSALPGPTSTEVSMYTGRRWAGIPGLVVAGLAFIVPAAVVMGVLAWAYVRFGTRPAAEGLFRGIQPVVVAVVAVAVAGLGRTALKNGVMVAIGVAVLAAYLAGVNEPVLLFLAAAVAAMAVRRPFRTSGLPVLVLPFTVSIGIGSIGIGGAVARPASDVDLAQLFAVFLKIGALLFGSGYVLLAFLRNDLVLDRAWLTERQLLDAIAIGQATPGPLFTTATFVGYLLAGAKGAVVATVAIFLPSFVMVAALDPIVTRMRRSPVAGAALDGLNVAAVALMAGVTWFLAKDAVVDGPSALIAAAAAVALLRWRVDPAWLVGAGALTGLVLFG